jgi:hypothetical protein
MPDTLDAEASAPETPAGRTASHFKWVGGTSLFFAIVQSVCTIFVALSGLRLLLGVAAFTAAVGTMRVVDKIHTDAIRVPMVMFALLGAVFNLVALWQVRRLRGRAASAWRQKPIAGKKFASEGVQLTLSVLTLILLALESFYHWQYTHHL